MAQIPHGHGLVEPQSDLWGIPIAHEVGAAVQRIAEGESALAVPFGPDKLTERSQGLAMERKSPQDLTRIARALRQAKSIDPAQKGQVPSTKGTL